MIRSLRGRLLIGTTAVTAAALLVLGAAIDTTVRRALLSEFDTALIAKATSVASMVEQHGGRVQFEFQSSMMPEFAAAKDPEYFEVWLKDRPFVRSQSLGTSDLAFTSATTSPQINWTKLRDGRRGRTVALAFSPYIDPDEPGGMNDLSVRATILVARDTAALDHLLAQLRWAALGLCVGAIVISGTALVLLIRHATGPLNNLAEQLETLDESDLNTRLETDGLPSELAPVVDRLNGLLSRLDTAFARERSFTADVAHELRTPVAGLLATLEVCRTRSRSASDYEATIDKAVQQLSHLQSLVQNLLLLARADAGQLQIAATTVDAAALVEECWLSFADCATHKRLHVTRELAQQCAVRSDPNLLRMVIMNLLDNAVTYVDAGGSLAIQIAARGDRASLEISNSGSLLKPEDAQRVFARFWRGDASRSHNGRHAGLGLSLSQRLLAIMGDTISIESTSGGRFTARVNLNAINRGGAASRASTSTNDSGGTLLPASHMV